jgi:hypothetical protein
MANLQAFLDGATGAGLFGKRSWPGAPTEFIDSRSPTEFDAAHEAQRFAYRRSNENQSSPRRLSDDLGHVAKAKAEGRG